MGLLLFSDDIELYVPPKKGLQHSFRIIRNICDFKRKSSQSDIEKSLSFLNKILKKKSHIFIFSDFLNFSFEKKMGVLSHKHDVVSVILSDVFERQLPPMGLVDIEDMESGQQKTVDLSSRVFQREFQSAMEERVKKRKRQLSKARCDSIFIDCQKDIYQPLIDFFKKRVTKPSCYRRIS